MPPLSASCRAPSADAAIAEPLPRVAAAVAAHQPLRVLAIGSSTSGLWRSSARDDFRERIQAVLDKVFKGLTIKIINRGVSGEVASTTAERLKTEVAMEQPDLVLWQLGTNDALARVPVEDFVATVEDSLEWLREHQIDTVMVGLQYTPQAAKDEYYTSIRAALRDVAARQKVLLIRRFEARQLIAEARAADADPPDDGGSHCVAEYVARALAISAFLAERPR